MTSDLQALNLLHQQLREQVTRIFTTAYAIEQGAGLSPAWVQLCQEYGVTPLDDQQRRETWAALRPLRGAAVAEFKDTVAAAVASIRKPLRKLERNLLPEPVQRSAESLAKLLERTEHELVTAYRGAVLPKSGGMFANVFAANRQTGPAQGEAQALTCLQCGAPRLNTRDFNCAYCGQHIFGVST